MNRASRRLRPILDADGKPLLDASGRERTTHIRGLQGFQPGRAPKPFRGCQSPRARSRRAAKAAKLVEAG